MSLSTTAAATPAPKADATKASSLTSEVFLGQWTTSTQQSVLVVHAGEDKPGVLKAVLTKPDAPEGSKPLQLLIKMDHQQWRCGNGVLVVESAQEQPSEISWVSWNGIRSTWIREKSWSDVAKALKPEDSTADQPKAAGKKVPSTKQNASNKQAANGMKAEHFLGHWKNSQGYEVNVTHMDVSQGLLTATIAKKDGSQELLLDIDTSVPGGGRWRCGNGHLHDHVEYDNNNKQAKTLTWMFARFNKWTGLWETHVSTWERECDGSSTDEGTEEKDGTWYHMTQDWENEQTECALKKKIMNKTHEGQGSKKQQAKAARATQNNVAPWVDPRWLEVSDKTHKGTKGAGKNQWREVDGWKKKAGYRQKKAFQ